MALARTLGCGALAGAAGVTALNAITYLDMVVRGRAASTTPERSVETLAGRAGIDIPGDAQAARNRVAGLGPLLGIATGVGIGTLVGAAYALRRPPLPVGAALTALAAMAASFASMTAIAVTDPRTWSATDWVSDAVPHAVYGLVTATALELLQA